MLHRSFKPAKCKTSLKLATSRLKLMKNKKGVQLNQMKKELAQLLESGKDQTARIRVEHVIREEKMITAYDLIEIYCELIAARLPIIESQKNCPIDLKEAIASVIFASPRCADIPELLDIRKHFTAKYGKEFISRAIELRPDCGVSRMLIEKLSAVAPEGQSKMKVLNAIAEEHNIKWEPKSFGEKDSKPTDDLLNGPNTSEKASKMPVESPNFQTPNVQVPPIHDQKHGEPSKFSEQNMRSSLGSQKFSSADVGGINTKISSTSHPDVRPSGMGSEGIDMRQSLPGDGNAFLSGRQNWHMDFKDAISAAQAAAESAERASIAARTAAELSNIHGLRDERHRKYSASNLRGEHPSNESVGNSFQDRNLKINKGQLEGNIDKSNRPASSTSSETSTDDDTLVNSIRNISRCSKKSSFEEEAENPFSSKSSLKRQSRESSGFKSENLDYFGEENTFSGDYSYSNSNHPKFGNDVAEDPFVGIGQGSIHRETKKMNSYEDCSSSDSDVDSFDIGPKYDEGESPSYFSSPGRKSPTHFPPLSTFRGCYSVSNEKSPSQAHFSAEWHSPLEFSENSVKWVDHSQSDNSVPVTFDYSYGTKFDSDDELEKSGPSGTKDSNILPREQDIFTLNPEPADCHCSHGLTVSSFSKKGNSGSDGSLWLQNCSDDSDSMEVGRMKKQGTKASPSSSETASSSRVKIGPSKASSGEQQHNTLASSSYENPKTSSVSEQSSSGDNSRKNAIHVHPKLPDYDVVAAHLQSLRKHA